METDYAHVRAILEAPDPSTARMLLQQTIATFGEKASRAMQTLETGFDDATAVLGLPEKYRKRLRTTNSVERLNEEVRRRERVIRIFPNRESVVRLIGALLMEQELLYGLQRRKVCPAEQHLPRKQRPVQFAGAQDGMMRIFFRRTARSFFSKSPCFPLYNLLN